MQEDRFANQGLSAGSLVAGREQSQPFIDGFIAKLDARISQIANLTDELRRTNDRHLPRAPSELKNQAQSAPSPEISTARMRDAIDYLDKAIKDLGIEINRYQEL